MEPKYPDVEVTLVGEDGNAFAILGKVSKALKEAGLDIAADDFLKEAFKSDYHHFLQIAMAYVVVN